MSVAALLVAALLVAACAGMGGTPMPPKVAGYALPPEVRPLDVSHGVEVYAPVGNINVETAATPTLEKRLTVSAESLAAAEAIAARCQVVVGSNGIAPTLIELVPPDDIAGECVGADTTIRLPVGLELRLRTQGGLIDTTDYAASAATIQTSEGTVLLGNLLGDVHVETQRGRIELCGSWRRVEARSFSGDLVIRQLTAGGTLAFRSRSGTCTIEIDGTVPIELVLRTIRGQTNARLPSGAIVTETKNGAGSLWKERRVRLRAQPEAAVCKVVVESEDGDVLLRTPTGSR